VRVCSLFARFGGNHTEIQCAINEIFKMLLAEPG
jgi:hypothetical protein